jgi:CRP-like cAMP-binding protein
VIEKHLLKLRARDDISPAEEAAIRGAVREVIKVPARKTLVRENHQVDFSTILLSGFACRRKSLADGRTQITELHTPGDFTDLHSFTLKHLDHDIVTISECRFAVIPHERLKEITEQHPHLTRVYWFATNLDAAIHREWELSLGRRSAIGKMAHLFCELRVRLDLVGLVNALSYDFPLTQEQLADTLALTAVHANRTLQELRGNGAVEFRHGRVTIGDLEALERIAEFDPAYLYLKRQPR